MNPVKQIVVYLSYMMLKMTCLLRPPVTQQVKLLLLMVLTAYKASMKGSSIEYNVPVRLVDWLVQRGVLVVR